MRANSDANPSRRQRRRIMITVLILGALAAGFFIAALVRFS
jgi:hypothetical protein